MVLTYLTYETDYSAAADRASIHLTYLITLCLFLFWYRVPLNDFLLHLCIYIKIIGTVVV
jgi:hypothetical protein